MHGWGELSADLIIISSGVPDKPLAASVTIVNLNVLVEWSAPFDNFGQITKYKTAFALHSSTETFVEETEHCDQHNILITVNTQCLLPMSVLRSGPWSLVFDELIKVKISACNLNGCGEYSDYSPSVARV